MLICCSQSVSVCADTRPSWLGTCWILVTYLYKNNVAELLCHFAVKSLYCNNYVTIPVWITVSHLWGSGWFTSLVEQATQSYSWNAVAQIWELPTRPCLPTLSCRLFCLRHITVLSKKRQKINPSIYPSFLFQVSSSLSSGRVGAGGQVKRNWPDSSLNLNASS